MQQLIHAQMDISKNHSKTKNAHHHRGDSRVRYAPSLMFDLNENRLSTTPSQIEIKTEMKQDSVSQ